MRVGEVLELRWGDVMLDTGREALRVREPKNGWSALSYLAPLQRRVPVRGLRAALRARRASNPLTSSCCSARTAARAFLTTLCIINGPSCAPLLACSTGMARHATHRTSYVIRAAVS